MFKQYMNLGAQQMAPFADVHEHVRADDAGKWDAIVPRCDLALKDGELVLALPDEERRLELLPLAGGQLASRLGIPTNYWRILPNVLKDHNANYWLQAGRAGSADPISDEQGGTHRLGAKPEKWLVRSRFNAVRAVLSEHYSPLDNSVLCDTIAPLLSERHGVNWFGLEDEGFHLHILDPDRVRSVLPDDDYFCGVYVGNSETGTRSVQCEAYLMRLVCKNGLVAMLDGVSLMRRRHIHIDSARFQTALAEAVQTALDTADGFIETLRRTTSEPVPDVDLTLTRLGEKWNLSEVTQSAARSAILREAPEVQETCYGLVQGLTEAAQALPDMARHDLEVLSGRLAQHGVPIWALSRDEEREWDGSKARRTLRVGVPV